MQMYIIADNYPRKLYLIFSALRFESNAISFQNTAL